MNENELSREIVDAAYRVHYELGPGLLESVYEAVLAHELSDRGLEVQRQVPIPLRFRGMEFPEAYRADLIIDNSVLIELKSVETVSATHKKQVLSYLRVGGFRLGLLINFGDDLFRRGVCRLANRMPDNSVK